MHNRLPLTAAASQTKVSFDPYRILKVSRTASADEIRRAFLEQART